MKERTVNFFTGENKKRNNIIFFAIIILLSFVYYKYFYNKNTTTYEFVKVERKDIKKTVEGGGKVVAVGELDIQQLQNGGKVTSIRVKPGDKVKKGDIIATLDNRSQLIQVSQARANYNKVVNGATDIEMQILQQAYQNAKNSYDLTVKSQELNISNSKRTLYNTSVAAISTYDTRVVPNNPTVTGSYICDYENEYRVIAQGVDLVNVSDTKGNLYTLNISSVPQALGSCGLYLTFDSSKSYANGDWKVSIPNKTSTSYVSNLNSYNSALQARDTALLSASTSVATAYLNWQQKVVGARSEDIMSAKANLDSANLALENTIIRAPFDGEIGSVSAIVGQQTNSQQGVATIITNTKFAEISLNEVDVVNVRLGQPVDIKIDALPDKTFKGTITQINTVGVEVSNVTSFGVKISIDDGDERVKSGMSLTAKIITDQKLGVLSVPASAIKTNNGKSVVERKIASQNSGQSKTEKVLLEVGLTNDIDTEIISGLSEGEEILYKTSSKTVAKTTTTFSLFGGGGQRQGGR